MRKQRLMNKHFLSWLLTSLFGEAVSVVHYCDLILLREQLLSLSAAVSDGILYLPELRKLPLKYNLTLNYLRE